MNFNKIEMMGFKSFADRMEIKFEVGVTGIVGPNGCGKSNVADAIRWVLGEQSARQLRGTTMQDVIFNGTQDRKALSYCEVSLYFDNSNRMFSDFDYDELVITRKLYRSGESEYYVNKQIARLKDIVNILHGGGIGKEGYSIIGQGKVEELLSAKPEERRAIFEEATGIAKFKSERSDIERKLERTKDNLVRYVDIIGELERQIAPLKRQAEDAKKYKELSEQIKYQEVNHFVFKAENVGAERAKVQERIDAIVSEMEQKDGEFSAAQMRYEKIGTDIVLNDAAVQKVNEEILQNSVDNEKRLGDSKVYGEKINACRAEINRISGGIAEKEKEKAAAEAEITKKTEEKAQKNTDLATVDALREKEQAELVSLIRQISESEGVSEENRRKMMESFQSFSDAQISMASLKERKNLLTGRQQEVVDKVEDLKAKMRETEVEGQRYMKQAADLKGKNEELGKVISEKQTQSYLLGQKVKEFNEKIIELNSRLASMQARRDFLKDMRTSYEGFGEAVKSLMRASDDDREIKKRIRGVVAKIIKTDQQYFTALETALGGSMQSVVTDTPEDTKYLINYLKKNSVGRVTFLPISSVHGRSDGESVMRAARETGAIGVATSLVTYDKVFDGVIRNLLGNTLVVDTIDNAIAISKKYMSAFKIVTLDGEIFTTQGAITGGSTARNAHLLGGDKQLANMEGEVDRAKQNLEKGQALVEEYTERQRKMAEEVESIRVNITKNEQDILVFNEKAMSFAAAYERLKTEMESYSSEMNAISATLSALSKEANAAEEGNEEITRLRELSESDQKKYAEELDALKKRRDELAERTTKREIERNALISALGVLSTEIDRLGERVAVLTQEIAAEKGVLEVSERTLADLSEAAARVALSKEEQDIVAGMRSHLKELEEKKSDLLREQVEIDREKQEIQTAVMELKDRRTEEDIALAKIDSDLEHLAENIRESYEMDYDACMEMKDANFDDRGSVSETARLKRERGLIKNVNLNAEEDYAEVSARYEEMSAQKSDVETAESDLTSALEKLTNEMLSTFNAGFKKINDNFQQTFKELFGGGNATLELETLEEGMDPLSAGIEIKAEPPGKKLQKISLLSGGERALTAIAILFAILQTRPMPFCLLDEIEAALDEANVGRFASYLKKFSEKTQFIVITHRKPTMEMADALYGVTMQEKGVSKMVSVKLSDIDDSMIEPQKELPASANG